MIDVAPAGASGRPLRVFDPDTPSASRADGLYRYSGGQASPRKPVFDPKRPGGSGAPDSGESERAPF